MALLYKERGGAWIGWSGWAWWLPCWQGTWPFGSIEIYDDRVIISIFPLDMVELRPQEIKKVRRVCILPFVADGVYVRYAKLNESSFCIFWSLWNAKKIVQMLLNKMSKTEQAIT